ncbi:uncharacterized protein DFL_005713 [Arthrobotrys flagrans]|uniref:Receptor L-domain domain-containing protein n=1 Tax=Arthrobotrys flagrans TaxID=97331 RepID=A0A436ZYU1_ARTFL|nr:hypothetical protein DFL_005713 [Arthrobotrys flagrans]
MRLKTLKLSLIYSFTTITVVSSQSTSNCIAELQTINPQSDLDVLSNCVTLSGSLDFGRDIINATIKGIQTTRGALRIPYGAKVQRLEAPDLSFIGGIMHLNGALNLTVLRMPSLTNVGSLRLTRPTESPYPYPTQPTISPYHHPANQPEDYIEVFEDD